MSKDNTALDIQVTEAKDWQPNARFRSGPTGLFGMSQVVDGARLLSLFTVPTSDADELVRILNRGAAVVDLKFVEGEKIKGKLGCGKCGHEIGSDEWAACSDLSCPCPNE